MLTVAAETDPAPARVLVVDDEPTIGEVVCRYLQRAGFDTRVAGDGFEALALAAKQAPDLVVLDLMLPGIDGLEVMRRLRQDHPGRLAVILLTAKDAESDRVIGLQGGADDYVAKPFSPSELVARVQAVLRRSAAASPGDPPLEVAGVHIDPAGRRVLVRGAEVSLTQREFDLLAFLARHPGQVFSRDRLMDAVWRLPVYSDTSTVTVHIRRLRAKVEVDSDRPELIQTVWGIGYRFGR
jgi:DNA-binding response OmpR family regulator